MEWVDTDDNNKVKKVTYTDCRPLDNGNGRKVDPAYKAGQTSNRKAKDLPLDPGQCQCDHMFEADELLLALRKNKPASWSDAQIKDLCNQPEYQPFVQKLVDRMNSVDNMRPLYGGPNRRKNNFISPADLNYDSGNTAWKKFQVASGDSKSVLGLNMGIMDRYMTSASAGRQKTAQDVDTIIKDLKFADTNAANVWKQLELTREVELDDKSKVQMGLVEAENRANMKSYVTKLENSNFKSKVSVDNSKVPTGSNVVPRRSDRIANQKPQCSDAKTSKKTIGKRKR